MTEETRLRIFVESGGEVPFLDRSATFIQCSVEPISQATQLERTVNGRLVDLSDPAFRKLAVSLSASDNRLPPVADLRVGQLLTIELPIVIRERGTTPARPAVSGSVVVGNGWVEYRPVLDCMLVGTSFSDTEWRPSASWALQLEEA